MKCSRYNLYIPYENKIIIFNGVSKKFILIEKSILNIFKEYINNPKTIIKKQISDKLNTSGFIINDEVDEVDLLFNNRNKILFAPYYTLMILPTYDCNFKCWYCVQKHTDIYMRDDLICKIKKHIKNYLIQHQIKLFELAWFGGEPLLNFESIVNICQFASRFCSDNNIVYHNSITTNGFLINESMAKEMNKLNFNHFQITIDGCRDKHNKVKYDTNSTDNAFDKTLSNIVLLLENIPNASILLRFNYTFNNIDEHVIVNDINNIIPIKLRDRISFNLQKVWQIDESKIETNKFYNLKYLISESGYKLSALDLSNYYCCYVERKHYNSIFPNNNIVKCSNCDIDNAEGFLNNDGDIIWHNRKNYELKDECFDCQFLPICFGQCPEKRFSTMPQQKKCNDENFHLRNIIDYCESVMLNELSINKTSKN
jgi:uncharacterized protein